MPQFDFAFYPSQIFWATVLIAVLYFLVSRFISPLAEKIRDKRRDFIEGALEDASFNSDSALSLKSEYEESLSKVEKEAEKIKAKIFAKVNLEFEKKKAIFNEKMEIQRQKALKEILSSVKLSDKEKLDFCVNLSMGIIEKITGAQASEHDLEECYRKVL